MSKMTTNSQLSTTEPKKQKQKLSNENRKRITKMEVMWRVISGVGVGDEWGKSYRE